MRDDHGQLLGERGHVGHADSLEEELLPVHLIIQIWTHFVEAEQPALQPLASVAFPFFTAGEPTVHTDGHVEVAGAFYPVPLVLLGQRLRVQWNTHLVRVFQVDTLVGVHARVAAGVFAPRAGEAEASTRQQAYVDRLVGQCERSTTGASSSETPQR